jgi:hypothetical protein
MMNNGRGAGLAAARTLGVENDVRGIQQCCPANPSKPLCRGTTALAHVLVGEPRFAVANRIPLRRDML